MKQILTFIHICRSFLFFFVFSNGASGGTITVVNDCAFTVWPAISSRHVLDITGFELTEGNSHSFQTPANWTGTLWGRTGCTFNESGHGSCKIGDCGSDKMECNGRSPNPPVTVAGFDFTEERRDVYNVSVINGYNLQMTVEPTRSDCLKMGCVYDLNKRCPRELRLEGGGGCNTACQVFGTPEYCCDPWISPNCTPTPYFNLFSSVCSGSRYASESYIGDSSSLCDSVDYKVRFCPPDNAFSTIKVDNHLSYYDQLFSIGGNFMLGFFIEAQKVWVANASDGYLGIWYTGDAEARKVWVANPNNPIIIPTLDIPALSIDQNTGNLIITDGLGTPLMKITDVHAGPNPNVTATLEDNGNFRLINEIDKRVLWQSFDHPTNVLLPGMKLGYNTRTGQNWTLTSWLTDDSFDTGPFTLSWEPINETSERLMIRQRGQPYWSSGFLLRDATSFEYMFFSYGYRQHKYNLTSVRSNEERYFSYIDDPGYENMSDTFPMLILTPNGQITNYNISNTLTPEFCYGYNSGDGCIDSHSPPCWRKRDYFSYLNKEFASQITRYITDSNSTISISDCFVKCLNDCSCIGFNSSNSNGSGCVIWTGSNDYFIDVGGNITMKYVLGSKSRNNLINPVSTSNYIGNKKEKNMKQIWALVAVPLFLGLGLLWYMKKRKQKRKEYKRRKTDEYFLELASSESFKDVHQLESDGRYGDLLLFSFASIMAATRDFSSENKLGQGGFGPVYKGRLDDGREIAIKRLSRSSGQGLVEFKNELILIARLQHTNLVRILGCCIHREEKMLVYEYMPNKSLDFFLFDETKAELDWPKRFNIIEGIAQGLLYLHKYSRMRVIHRYLKSNNILLDDCMNPKISDFGMARMFNQNETEATTNRVVGTYGYMSPEYAMEGTFSVKSDIYSFGVLILEIVSGRRNSSFVYLDRTFSLLGYAWELWQQGNAMDLEDPILGSTCVEQQFLRTIQVALLCVQDNAMDRPTTSDMISMLLNDTIPLPSPKRPAFFTHIAESTSSLDQIKPEDCSLNKTTMSAIEGR